MTNNIFVRIPEYESMYGTKPPRDIYFTPCAEEVSFNQLDKIAQKFGIHDLDMLTDCDKDDLVNQCSNCQTGNTVENMRAWVSR